MAIGVGRVCLRPGALLLPRATAPRACVDPFRLHGHSVCAQKAQRGDSCTASPQPVMMYFFVSLPLSRPTLLDKFATLALLALHVSRTRHTQRTLLLHTCTIRIDRVKKNRTDCVHTVCQSSHISASLAGYGVCYSIKRVYKFVTQGDIERNRGAEWGTHDGNRRKGTTVGDNDQVDS